VLQQFEGDDAVGADFDDGDDEGKSAAHIVLILLTITLS
jgi:hypothetical protein